MSRLSRTPPVFVSVSRVGGSVCCFVNKFKQIFCGKYECVLQAHFFFFAKICAVLLRDCVSDLMSNKTLGYVNNSTWITFFLASLKREFNFKKTKNETVLMQKLSPLVLILPVPT